MIAFKRFISIMSNILIMTIICVVFCSYATMLCTHWWGAEASMEVLMPLITANQARDAGSLGTYAILSMLPDKIARFLIEFHSVRF
jgi:hypothetical protein